MSGDYEYLEEEAPPVREKATDTEQFMYWFDNFFATNPMAKVYLLCTVNVVFMVFFGVCFHITGSQNGDWAENFWMGFTFAADMAEDDHGGPFPYWMEWVFRIMNFTFSFGGAFIFGLVISFLSNWIDERVEGLRQGKSKVLEQGHTLILGWNDRMLGLLEQMCDANSSEGGLPIVILADRDKMEMDEWLMDAFDIESRMGSKIVTRRGSPIEAGKLVKVAAHWARSIIVLSDPGDAEEADAQAVRRVLALTAGLEAQGKQLQCHVVLEIQDIDNAEVAMLGVTTGVPEDTVIPVVSHDVVGKLMIQCAREIGLSSAFGALMCFAGSECYFSSWDDATGERFADICYYFEGAAVLGVRFADPSHPSLTGGPEPMNPGAKPFMLNPPGDYVILPGDQILVIAEDNDTYWYEKKPAKKTTPIPPFKLPPKEPERFMLAGWRRDMDDLVNELDKWVPPGSFVTLFNRHSVGKQLTMLAMGGLELPGDETQTVFDSRGVLENITQVELVTGDCTSARQLDRLGPKKLSTDAPDRHQGGTKYRVEEYNSCLCLSIETTVNGMSPDSRVMSCMMIMRYIQSTRGVHDATLVAEILDPRTQSLMSFTKCTDAVVGNAIVAMILAQIGEDRKNGYVMEDLFSEEGMEMHVKDIRLFVGPNELLSWWDIVDRCQQRNMLPLGWIRKEGDNRNEYEVELNPENKNEKIRFTGKDAPDGDLLIVISED